MPRHVHKVAKTKPAKEIVQNLQEARQAKMEARKELLEHNASLKLHVNQDDLSKNLGQKNQATSAVSAQPKPAQPAQQATSAQAATAQAVSAQPKAAATPSYTAPKTNTAFSGAELNDKREAIAAAQHEHEVKSETKAAPAFGASKQAEKPAQKSQAFPEDKPASRNEASFERPFRAEHHDVHHAFPPMVGSSMTAFPMMSTFSELVAVQMEIASMVTETWLNLLQSDIFQTNFGIAKQD